MILARLQFPEAFIDVLNYFPEAKRVGKHMAILGKFKSLQDFVLKVLRLSKEDKRIDWLWRKACFFTQPIGRRGDGDKTFTKRHGVNNGS